MGYEKVIVAFDNIKSESDAHSALAVAKQLKEKVWGFKVNSAIYEVGLQIIDQLAQYGKVFVDVKLHDIPATVANSAEALARNKNVDLFTVHAQAGKDALEAAAKAGGEKVVAVTVLTSEEDVPDEITERVVTLAKTAYEAGVRNIVCSAHEVCAVREALGNPSDLTIITPGIRSLGGEVHDQKRVATPEYALGQGADLLVVGREITDAKDPAKALDTLVTKKN